MKRIISILCLALVNMALYSSALAADFRYGDWFGEEDWSSESCRISKHVQDEVFFFAEENWEGKFWIGLYGNKLSFPHEYTVAGAVVFGDEPPLMLVGKGLGSRLIFEAKNPDQLKYGFLKKSNLRLSFDDQWLQTPLSASARAGELLAECAKKVWPGAGDGEDSKSAGTDTLSSPAEVISRLPSPLDAGSLRTLCESSKDNAAYSEAVAELTPGRAVRAQIIAVNYDKATLEGTLANPDGRSDDIRLTVYLNNPTEQYRAEAGESIFVSGAIYRELQRDGMGRCIVRVSRGEISRIETNHVPSETSAEASVEPSEEMSNVLTARWSFNRGEEDWGMQCFVGAQNGELAIGFTASPGKEVVAYVKGALEGSAIATWQVDSGTPYDLSGSVNDYFGWQDFDLPSPQVMIELSRGTQVTITSGTTKVVSTLSGARESLLSFAECIGNPVLLLGIKTSRTASSGSN